MQHPETDTGPFWPALGEKEQTVFTSVPLMTGTALSHKSGILYFVDNPFSRAQADGNRSMSSALAGLVPWALVG